MSVLSSQTIRRLGLITPCREASKDHRNCSRGLSVCGYDLSIAEDVKVYSLPKSVAFLFLASVSLSLVPSFPLLALIVGACLAVRGGYGLFHSFRLASAVESFQLPDDVVGNVCDKSSLSRRGLIVLNTIVEPGWRGFLTLELINLGPGDLAFEEEDAVAQVVFKYLDEPTELPYDGKYQDQPRGPQEAL